MAKKYYQVIVRHHFFLDSTGMWDYVDDEYSGIIHTRKSDAEAELMKAYKEICKLNSNDDCHIEEMEN